jgi:hypothetical protein
MREVVMLKFFISEIKGAPLHLCFNVLKIPRE